MSATYPLVLVQSRLLRLFTFFYLYMMQGVPAGFALTALANYLLAQGQTAKQVGTFVALVGLPWTMQFVWGPLIDRFQLTSMGRYKSWVLLSQLGAFVASLALLLVKDPLKEISMLSACFFLHSIFASLQDASVDAMAINVSPVEERGRVNACMRGGMLIGSSLGGVVMALCIHRLGFTEAVVLQALFLLSFTVFTFFVKEQKQDLLFSLRASPANQAHDVLTTPPTLASIFRKLFIALFSKLSLRTFSTIALVYVCLSIFVRTFNVHLIQQLHWTDTYLSTLSGSYVVVGAMLVMVIGGILSDKMGARKLLLIIMGIIGVYLLIFNLMAPLWSNRTLSSGGLLLWYMFDPSFSIAAMPILMNISHKGIEGSQFTTYMSLVNFSEVAGAYISGYALLWLSAPTVGICCGLFILMALLYLVYVGRKSGQ